MSRIIYRAGTAILLLLDGEADLRQLDPNGAVSPKTESRKKDAFPAQMMQRKR